MTIEILRYPTAADWMRCKELALNTMGKRAMNAPTDEWKRKILTAEHSPIRTLMFTVRMKIPYYVSVHFCRHKFGVEHYVSTQRNDRQDECDRNTARQDRTVTHIMDLNAAALIATAQKRLCYQADPVTKSVMEEIRSEVIRLCPEFGGILVLSCEYRGKCPEMVSCGYFERAM